MHVGGGEGDVAEAGGEEFKLVCGFVGDALESVVCWAGEAGVMEGVVREEGAAVAVEAVCSALAGAWVVLGEEEFEAALFLFC